MTVTIAGTWASIADVDTVTGYTVTQEQLVIAQTLVEGLVGRIWRSTDETHRDHYWLARAVAWQAVYVQLHPELLNLADVRSLSQDGFSVTFRDGNRRPFYSPTALVLLNNITHGANASLRVNSEFQPNRVGRERVRGRAGNPWGWRRI